MTDPTVATDPAATPPEPAPVLMGCSIRPAANGFILSAQFSRSMMGLTLPQNEYIFATSTDVIAWLKAQGWSF
jgi:hypothetical protein